MTNPDTPFLTCPVTYRTSRDHPMIDLFGESCFHVDNSGALTTEWNDHLRSVWLNIIRRAGLRASAETPHLLHDSQKRPDVKVRVGKQVTLLDVRTSSTTTTGTDSTQECAATPSYSAEMGAKSDNARFRFRNHAASCILLTSAIGVARRSNDDHFKSPRCL